MLRKFFVVRETGFRVVDNPASSKFLDLGTSMQKLSFIAKVIAAFFAIILICVEKSHAEQPFCPAALIEINDLDNQADKPLVAEAGVVKAANHVADLRARLAIAAREYYLGAADHLSQPEKTISFLDGEAARHVNRLRAELTNAVTEKLQAQAVGGEVEIASRSAAVDSLLDRISTYERFLARGSGQATTPLNVLPIEDLQRIASELKLSQSSIAVELASKPPGTSSASLEARLAEVSGLVDQIETERSIRIAGSQPKLLAIRSDISRAEAIRRFPEIQKVDSESKLPTHYSKKLLVQLELRETWRPADASIAETREKVLADLRSKLLADVGAAPESKDVVASIDGKRRLPGPNSPRGPPFGPFSPQGPPVPPSPAGPMTPGGGAPTGELTDIRTALFNQLEAARERNITRIATNAGQLESEIEKLRTVLPEGVWARGGEFYALSNQDLIRIHQGYKSWLEKLTIEASSPRVSVELANEISFAEERLRQLRVVARTRFEAAWRGVVGGAVPARAPPIHPNEIATLWRARSESPLFRAAERLKPVTAAQIEAAILVQSSTGETSNLRQSLARIRSKQFTAEADIYRKAVATLIEIERASVSGQYMFDLDFRRSVVSARAALAGSIDVWTTERDAFFRANPNVEQVGLEIKRPTSWKAREQVSLRAALEKVESARHGYNAKSNVPVSVADDAKARLADSPQIRIGRFGAAPSTANLSFETLFPKSASWTHSRAELQSNIKRLPGGIVIDPVLSTHDLSKFDRVLRNNSSGFIYIGAGKNAWRTNLKATGAEYRDALGFAVDGRLIAVDIRGLAELDVRWILQNAFGLKLTALTGSQRGSLLRELAMLSSANLHPALEYGPWALSIIDADKVIFEVLPRGEVATEGDLAFEGMSVRNLRTAFRADQALFRSDIRNGDIGATSLKSVMTFTKAALHCDGNRVNVRVELNYDVYLGDNRMHQTSVWLKEHDIEIRKRSSALQDAARFAAIQALLKGASVEASDISDFDLIGSASEPVSSPKFLCGERRFGLQCDLTLISKDLAKPVRGQETQ